MKGTGDYHSGDMTSCGRLHAGDSILGAVTLHMLLVPIGLVGTQESDPA